MAYVNLEARYDAFFGKKGSVIPRAVGRLIDEKGEYLIIEDREGIETRHQEMTEGRWIRIDGRSFVAHPYYLFIVDGGASVLEDSLPDNSQERNGLITVPPTKIDALPEISFEWFDGQLHVNTDDKGDNSKKIYYHATPVSLDQNVRYIYPSDFQRLPSQNRLNFSTDTIVNLRIGTEEEAHPLVSVFYSHAFPPILDFSINPLELTFITQSIEKE